MTTINNLRQTHTFVILELSQAAYDEIAEKLRAAGYDYAFNKCEGKIVIDMNGIAVGVEETQEVMPIVDPTLACYGVGTPGSLGSRSKFSDFDDLTTHEKDLNPAQGNLDELSKGMQQLFDDHHKKQPELSVHFAIGTQQQAEQAEEDSQWKPVENLTITDKKDEDG